MITKKQVKYIQSLSQKKLRDSEKQFVAEGPKIVDELLTVDALELVALYATEEWTAKQSAAWPVETVSDGELERISFLKTPNQVLAIFKKPEIVAADSGWELVLDGIQDPGNLGTIIRTADWFGVSRVVCSEDTADAFAPKVIQSTMSSIARVSVQYTDLEAYMGQQKVFVGAVLGGRELGSRPVTAPASLVIGNESKGIRPHLLPLLTDTVTIPRIGRAESLNAAVATGILLSHFTSFPASGK